MTGTGDCAAARAKASRIGPSPTKASCHGPVGKRAIAAKATLDSGMRMARINDKGEREILDDQQRAAELQRTNQAIAENCK